MYFRKQGRRFYVLHSYRDGLGRVCQRRLGHFSDENGLRRQLDEISERCPELSGSIPDLKLRALEKLRSLQPSPPDMRDRKSDKICRTARLLLRLLTEEAESETLSSVNSELALLKARLGELVPDPKAGDPEADLNLYRSRLSPRRRRFDPSDPMVRPYCEALDRLLEDLKLKGQVQACSELLERRLAFCSEPGSWLDYGAILQKMGRYDEASTAYARLPNRDPRKHYNLASVSFSRGQPEQAFEQILRGLTHDPEAWTRRQDWKDSSYWRCFGALWSEQGLRFLQSISGQTLVRFRLRTTRERGIIVRSLVPPIARKRLLEEAMRAAYPSLPASAPG